MTNIMGGKLVKLRVFEEDKLLKNKENLKIHFAVGLFDMGVGKDPIVQLSVAHKKDKLVKGDQGLAKMPELEPTEFPITQMQIVAAARRRIDAATPAEIKAFRKGSYIQMQYVASK